MCCVGRMIIIYKNLDQTLNEWSLTILSLCDLFVSLCWNASISLLFMHLLQLLLLFLSPGSHRHKLRNWYQEIVSPKADIKASLGWLTTAAAKTIKWKEIYLKTDKGGAAGRKGIMCWITRSSCIVYCVLLKHYFIFTLSFHCFGALLGEGVDIPQNLPVLHTSCGLVRKVWAQNELCVAHTKWESEVGQYCRSPLIEFSCQIPSLVLMLFGTPGRMTGSLGIPRHPPGVSAHILQVWFPTELVSSAVLDSNHEMLPGWVSYGGLMQGHTLQKFGWLF